MSRLYYEEKQFFAPWVYWLVSVLMIGAMVSISIAFNRGNPSSFARWFFPVYLACLYVFVLNILCLKIEISEDLLRLRLGYFVPIARKSIPLKDILESRVVVYRPIRDAGGWGIRFGRFEGHFCRFWNARGNRGVFLRTDKHRYVIGSQCPEAMHAALNTAKESTQPI